MCCVMCSVVVFCHSNAFVMGELLFRAQDLNMTNGEYVFYTMTTGTITDDRQPWTSFNMTGQNWTYRREAFYAMKEVKLITKWAETNVGGPAINSVTFKEYQLLNSP